MSSPPYMPLYIADYLSATEHLDAAHSGAYLHLIMHYWQKGKLPPEDKFLARIARMTDRQWMQAKPALAAFFTPEWTHDRIDLELDKASAKAQARAEAGSRGGNSKALKNNNSTLANATDLPQQTASKDTSKPLASSSGLERTDSSLRSLSGRETDNLAEQFYQAYPKHVDPKDAKAKFSKAVRGGADPHHIISAAKRWAVACRDAGTDRQFIPAPAVWLNRGSYDSEDLPQPARAGPHVNGSRASAIPPERDVHAAAQRLSDNIANGTISFSDPPKPYATVLAERRERERQDTLRLLPQGGSS